jgi:hypothetical protein
MCRSIKTLFNFDPPATDEEVRAAALQFVRNLSGFNTPSKVNESAFGYAVDEAFEVARRLINRLETSASTRNRGGKRRRRGSARPSGLGGRLRLEVEQSCDPARGHLRDSRAHLGGTITDFAGGTVDVFGSLPDVAKLGPARPPK